MGTLTDAVEYVLENQGEPQSCYWLVSLMEELKVYRVRGQNPERTVRAKLHEDMNRYGVHSRFVELEDGRFALRKWNRGTDRTMA